MHSYKIDAQFLKVNTVFDEEARKAVTASVNFYNSKSLIAANRKQIVAHNFSDDGLTLHITLESEAELAIPTKALRLFSVHLVEKYNFASRLSGRQLFKMTYCTSEERIGIVSSVEEKRLEYLTMEEFATLSNEEKIIEMYRLLLSIIVERGGK